MPWDPTQKAVAHHTDSKWVMMYVERWLKAPILMPDGTLKHRTMGTPQGGPMTPPTQVRTWGRLRVGVTVCADGDCCGYVCPGGDGVADHDLDRKSTRLN